MAKIPRSLMSCLIWLLCLLLVVPAASLAQTEGELPLLTAQYETQEGTQFVEATPAEYGGAPVYWLTLPENTDINTLQFMLDTEYGWRMEALQPELPVESSASFEDLPAYTVLLTQGEDILAAYPLYISYLPVPGLESVAVTVRFVDSAMGTVAEYTTDCPVGETPLYADTRYLPENYTLLRDYENVSVSSDGSYSPCPVVFEVEQQASEAAVMLPFIDAESGEALSYYTVNCPAGESTLSADTAYLPGGYTLLSSEVSVTVNSDGSYTLSPDGFYVQKQLSEVSVTVQFIDAESGEALSYYTVNCPVGETTLSADTAYLPGGYTLLSSEVSVAVNSDGSYTLSPDGFYVQKQLSEVSVTVQFIDAESGEALSYYTVNCPVGESTLSADTAYLPGGYTLRNSEVSVTVNSDGSYTLSPDGFYVQKQLSEVSVTVQFIDAESMEAVGFYTVICPIGDMTLSADTAYLPAGYTLLNPEASVTVNGDGSYTPCPVEFYVQKQPQTPTTAQITLLYVDRNSGATLATDTQTCEAGTTTQIYPDPSLFGAEYELESDAPVTVVVDASGNPDPNPVVFYAAAGQSYANVPIYYVNQENEIVLATSSEVCYEGTTPVYPDAGLLPGGFQLVSPDPVTVTVQAGGYSDPQEVTFYAISTAAEPVECVVPIQYIDKTSGSVLYETAETRHEGQQVLYPDTSRIPAGYALLTDSVEITVDAQGQATPCPVVFYLQPQESSEEYTVLREIGQWGVTNDKAVRLRKAPSTDTKIVDQLSKNTRLWVVSLVQPLSSSEEWYQVSYNEQLCFIKSEFVTLGEGTRQGTVKVIFVDVDTGTELSSYSLTLDEGETTLSPDTERIPQGYTLLDTQPQSVSVVGDETTELRFRVQAQETPETEPYTELQQLGCYGVTTAKGVNLRSAPSTEASSAGRVQKGTQLWVLSLVQANSSGEQWYKVSYDEEICFVFADLMELTGTPEASSAQITVRYLEGGNVIASETFELQNGSSSISPDASKLPAGYELLSTAPVTVTVSGGVATPSYVEFSCTPSHQTANLNVRYYNSSNSELLYSETRELESGVYSIAPDASLIPGYTLVSTNPIEVSVSGGVASPSVVSFYAGINAVNVPIFYYKENTSQELASDSVELGEGTHLVEPSGDIVSGYELVDASPVSVTVSAQGVASPASVYFYLREEAPLQGEIKLRCADVYGRQLKDDEKLLLYSGSYNAGDYLPEAPEGYEYASAYPDSFTVDSLGAVTPSSVITYTFVEKPAVTAKVIFRYVCGKKNITSPVASALEEGEHDTSEYIMQFDGYTLTDISDAAITVSAKGKASPDTVTFTYEKNKTEAELYIYYVDSIGQVLSKQTVGLAPGTHIVSPDESMVPTGYVLSRQASSVTVQVSDQLAATPGSVTFSCYSAGTVGTLCIQYVDSTTGSVIATEYRELSPGDYSSITPDESLLSPYGDYVSTGVIYETAVTVSESGRVSPSVISFYYKPKASSLYQGYLLVTAPTALRSSASQSGTVVQSLSTGALLWTSGQRDAGGITWNSSQTVLGNSFSGWVDNSYVKQITTAEAQALIEEYEESQLPDQNPGYYITIVNSAPLRSYPYAYASATFLDLNTVVYVYSQEYGEDGYIWHYASYDGKSGYIRDGQIRKMTNREITQYEQGLLTPTATPAPASTYSPTSASSYGYVSASSVNFRSSPSTSATKISSIKQYGMALILGTKVVDGVTWYHINYNGQNGWVSGEFFHEMTMSEFNTFLNSSQYELGKKNNSTSSTSSTSSSSTSSSTSSSSSGTSTQGQVSSVEDWNVSTWTSSAASTATYVPFNPYATPSVTATPDPSASPDPNATQDPNATADPSVTATPASTFVIGTMIPIDYTDAETEESGGSALGLVLGIAGVVVLGGAAGVYVYSLSKAKKRKEAAAAAAARKNSLSGAAAGVAAASQTRKPTSRPAPNPYSREAAQQREEAQNGGKPYGAATTDSGNPYGAAATNSANPYGANPYGTNPNSATTADSVTSHGAYPYGVTTADSGNPYGANPYSAAEADSANPYGATASDSGNPYGANPYSATAKDSGNPYGVNPYSATTTDSANPYGAATADSGNPYGANPYSATAAGSANPYGAATADSANPYGVNPYSATATDSANPYGAATADSGNPYSANPYGSNPNSATATDRANSYGANPYGAPTADSGNPYGANPYSATAAGSANPYGAATADSGNPYSANPYGSNPNSATATDRANSYGATATDSANPYGVNPYGATATDRANSYGAATADSGNPYSANPYSANTNSATTADSVTSHGAYPYGATATDSANLYGANPYSATATDSANPYSVNPYGATATDSANPYGAASYSAAAPGSVNPFSNRRGMGTNPYSSTPGGTPQGSGTNPFSQAMLTQENAFFTDAPSVPQPSPTASGQENPFAHPAGATRRRRPVRTSENGENSTDNGGGTPTPEH